MMKNIETLQDLYEDSPASPELTDGESLAMAKYYGYEDEPECEFG
jgi:hypothetical protein